MPTPLEVLRRYRAHDYTVPDALESRLERRADQPFLLFGDRRWTWREFSAAAARLACGLAARGIANADRVAIVAPNGDSHVLLLCALARLGAVMVPLNPEFGASELAYVLGHADPKLVVAGAEPLAAVRAGCKEAGLSPETILAGTERTDGLTALVDLARDEPGTARAPASVRPDDTLVIIYTSGTTGFPKGVMHSHRNFLLAGEAFVQRVHLTPQDRCMVVLPFYHMNALFYSLAGTVAAGASMLVVERFSASGFWDTAADRGATEVNIIEAIGTILASRPRSEYRPDHRIRAVYGVRENVAATFRDGFGISDLLGGYGMSEIPGVTCNPLGVPRRPGSMGPIGSHPDPDRPWAEARVVDEAGNDVGANEPGELWVRTPILMQGYFRDPGETRAAFTDGWFRTGDLVSRDGDGWFTFISRLKDIIRRRGENIAGAELDRVIGAHPDVLEAAAIAVPSELGEDEILVAVVTRDGRDITAEEIADWARARLAPNKVPRFVVFLPELPHTPTHKVAKAVLTGDATLCARATDLRPAGSATIR